MRKSLVFEAVIVLILIALLAVLYVMVAGGPKGGGGWTVSGVIAAPGSIYSIAWANAGNMFPGIDNTLITADGRKLYSIGSNGSILWSLDIPDKYRIPGASGNYDVGLVRPGDTPALRDATVYNGNIYLILVPEKPSALSGALMAVSGSGKALWNVSFPRQGSGMQTAYDLSGMGALETVFARNDTIYVYAADSRLVLVDLNGTVLKTIDHIQSVPSVDEDGNIYTIYGTYGLADTLGKNPVNFSINAYRPDGMLRWQRTNGELGVNSTLQIGNIGYQQPVYRNGSIFVWSDDGFAVLDRDGNIKWACHRGDAYAAGIGFDGNGTVYYSYYKSDTGLPNTTAMGIMTMAPDGTVLSDLAANGTKYGFFGVHDFPDGICYWTGSYYTYANASADESTASLFVSDNQVLDYLARNHGNWDIPLSIYDIGIPAVGAYDMRTGDRLWRLNLSVHRHEAVLNQDNARALTFDQQLIQQYNSMSKESVFRTKNIPQGSKGVKSMPMNELLIVNNTIYVSAWSYNYEVPAFYNESHIVYGGGVYALDLNGTLLWSKSLNARVIGVQEQNGTVFIGSGDGKVSGVSAGIVGGILAAASYLFFRFFFFGAVSRAKARLDRNTNRNRVLQFIRENPGASMFEMSQSLGMNMGTVRYHLLILGMNHRITSFKADEKYVRYFTNAGSYGPRDQLVISLMRREPLRKILNTLREKPGMSNLELSRALDAHESSTMRNVKELVEKGVVEKSLLPGGKIAYSLSNEYRVHTASACQLLNR